MTRVPECQGWLGSGGSYDTRYSVKTQLITRDLFIIGISSGGRQAPVRSRVGREQTQQSGNYSLYALVTEIRSILMYIQLKNTSYTSAYCIVEIDADEL